jgi:hypothetical protein
MPTPAKEKHRSKKHLNDRNAANDFSLANNNRVIKMKKHRKKCLIM